MRKFWIENEYGLRMSMNDIRTGFFTSPSGLGFSENISYINIGDSYIRSKATTEQGNITGVIVFREDPYQKYEDFISFICGGGKLKLVYSTSAGEYIRDVDVKSVAKSEIENGALQCEIGFACRSLFYKNQNTVFEIDHLEGELRFNFRWPARFNDYNNREVTVKNNGHVPAAFTAKIYGYSENPKIELIQNNKVVSSVKFPIILQQGELIEYSSLDGDLYCNMTDTEGITQNIVNDLDIENNNFFKIPVGESVLRVSGDTDATNKSIIQVFIFYKTV